jgi:uncharacterized phage protein (TIGR01671 family)
MVNAGEWLYGNLATCEEEELVWVNSWPVIPKTVGQFTGLRDKTGMNIFEGDIVKLDVSQYGKISGPIEWSEKECAFMVIQKNRSPASLAHVNENPEAIEVVGNIHDKEGKNEHE